MTIDEFTTAYNAEYRFAFHGEKIDNRDTFTKISEFLFQPRYKVDNLKFSMVG